MANLNYVVIARDSSSIPYGKPLTGLTPTWLFLKKLSDGSDVKPPAITEIGLGQYKLTFDPEISGDASGQIDLGATVPNPTDRYVDLTFYVSDSRTVVNLDAPVSSRSTYAGGPVAGVTAPVAVGSIGSGVITSAAFAPNAINSSVFGQDAADRVWGSSSRSLTAFGFSVMVSGDVTVGGYAVGMDPASLVFAKLLMPWSGRTTS